MEKEKVFLLYKGDLASTVLLYELLNQGKDVYAIGFLFDDKDAVCLDKMALLLSETRVKFKVVATDELRGQIETQELENQNLLSLSIALSYAQSLDAAALFYPYLPKGENSKNEREFLSAFARCAWYASDNKILFQIPYLEETLSSVILKGHLLSIPFEKIWSCEKEGDLHCGECAGCRERIEAFQKAHVTDLVRYANAIKESPKPKAKESKETKKAK